jgi:uncharacterized protein YndB with AHSA1/START domain
MMYATTNTKELTLSRMLNAPASDTFDAWVNSKKLAAWWGPKGFTNPVCMLDLRAGGDLYIEMTGPDGTVYPLGGRFQEITAPEATNDGRLIFLGLVMDQNNTLMAEILNTVTFTPLGNKTELTVHAHVILETEAAAQAIDGMEQGWTESLDKLEHLLDKLPSS